MKKMFVIGLVLGAILALGGMAYGVYSATSANAASATSDTLSGFAADLGLGKGPMVNSLGFGDDDTDSDHPLRPYVEAAVAEILGISVEDLQAAKDEGQHTRDLVEAAGLTMDEFRTALDEALPGIVEQALADGAITQEQADLVLERGLRMFGPGRHGGEFGGIGLRGDGVLQPYVLAAAADALGMTTEDLQAAIDDGTHLTDLLETA
ncbi:MAG TPA: hypothetical protein PK530_25290, partial [Anaerolineales bacterium]|nr:hypothetical protein [Anaerolineales bacterium]